MPLSGMHGARRVHLLVVEDRVNIREAVATSFDREPGFTVAQAASLTEARGMLGGVDVAILDVFLPDGNGSDLIQELHAIHPDAIAIVFTSSIDPAVVDQALRRGAAAVLNKQAGLDELVATVKRLR